MKLLFASANKNKIREIRALLPASIELLGLEDVGLIEEIPETGVTIKENSELKARFAFDFLRKRNIDASVFADDSGLEVHALNGCPGVNSAHYAGTPKNDVANNKKLLDSLKTEMQRTARFVTVITLIHPEKVYQFEGEISGSIAFEPRGTNGFGYDPLFIPRGLRSTFAELSAEAKNQISHRALAVKKLVDFLKENK
jgi:XTP/dITP diphosphohydrolase